MKNRHARPVVILSMALAGAVLVGIAWGFRSFLREQWYLARLRMESGSAREEAARALSALGSARAVRPLLEALASETEGGGQEAIAPLQEALERIASSGPRATEALLETLRSGEERLVAKVLSIEAQLMARTRSGRAQIARVTRPGSAPAVSYTGGGAAPLDRSERDFVAALRRDQRAVAAVNRALTDPDPERCDAAWRFVGALEPAEMHLDFLEGILRGLEDSRRQVRRAAAETLRRLGAEARAAAPRLAELFLDPEEAVRTAAFRALEEMNVDNVRPLVAALKDPQPPVRAWALRMLPSTLWIRIPAGVRGELVAVLEGLREDADPLIRRWVQDALRGLAAIGR